MGEHTARDAVWSLALQYALTKYSFSAEEVQRKISEDVSDGTIHDTLSIMVNKRWLSKESSKSQVWTSGPRLQNKIDIENKENEEDSETEYIEKDDVISISECDIYTSIDFSTDKIYVGTVDRVTGSSGMAIVNTAEGGREINLGPIDESAEGEKIHFKPENDIWARCIDEEYTHENGSLVIFYNSR